MNNELCSKRHLGWKYYTEKIFRPAYWTLQVEVTNFVASQKTGGQIRTDFTTFPTPALAKLLHDRSADSQCIGRVDIPATPGGGITIPLHLAPQQFKDIHQYFLK
ncbi:hypothetical protein LSH36_75g02043 [Paralvinella palmiformis]|uniref:Uncharacterized protein n=1 Tax=Paralvinella palmiformis TaxID=53620 RepID=A0AAD9K2D5_9ANNE|nr:hypothetical protein LSH36_75g02043 [Paralvinella palmiformis]